MYQRYCFTCSGEPTFSILFGFYCVHLHVTKIIAKEYAGEQEIAIMAENGEG